MATYDGTPDDDLLLGGDDDDILSGMAGDDTLRGGRGNDVLEGGAGADVLDGGDDDGLSPFFDSALDQIWGDTATYVHSDAGVTIDLAAGSAEGGHAEGDTLTGIESVRGSDHDDLLVARNDGSTLWGQRGDDLLNGGDGTDYLLGDRGNDTLMGGAGFDYLEGGAGADVLDGGEGFGYAIYELSDAGVTVNLATGEAEGGHAEGDTLTGIDSVWGSSHADRITGDAGRNRFVGSAGADVLDGGDGLDIIFYVSSDAGVTVNLATGEVEGGHAEGDTLTGIEQVWGSRHADHLIGGDGHQLFGWFGNDTLEGGAGNEYLRGGAGADVLDGGEGHDAVDYWGSDAGVTVNLATGTGQGGEAEGDTLRGIEEVWAFDHADHLIGDAGDNRLNGRGGDDTLEGGAGNDNLSGDMGADVLDGGEGHDTVDYWGSDAGVTVNLATGTGQGGEAEGDTLRGIEEVWAFDHADHLIGDAGDNRLNGRGGDDTLDGGEGYDTLQGGPGADMLDGGGGDLDSAAYWGSDAGVTVNLAAGTGQGGEAEGDTLTGFRRVFGSNHADRLIGDSGDNLFHGSGGNDTLEGGAGDDWLNGEAGEDLLTGGEGADRFIFGDGDTVTDFQDGSDRIDIREDFGHINAVNFDTNVTIRQSGDDVEVQIGDGVLTLTGVSAADVTADDFILADIQGSDHADHLIGDDGDNRLNGGGGDDTLEGGAGNDGLHGGAGADRLDGGDGHDWAHYWGSDAGVTVNLATGTGQGGHAEGDTLTEIESIEGSDHADHLTGDDGHNGFNGGAGADTIDGGEDYDYVGYWGSDAGVTVNLATGTGQGGHAEGDTLTKIESIHGSDHADHLIGNDGDNHLAGNDGNDTLEGGAGNDWLDGEDGEDLLAGGEGADTFVFGDGDTVTDFEDGSDLINIHGMGHINADNFEANVTIRQSGSNEDTDPFDFGRGDPFGFERDVPFGFERDVPFGFERDVPFGFERDDTVADVEIQIGDAVLTLNGVSAADITVDDFILA